MRLVELGLVRFGGFTDKILDLSGPGLHIVFGPNEAGKSTALRGITALLYGVPHRSTDGYLHDDLRLSGRIRAEDGSELAFERKKGRKNTLLAPGGAVLDEAVLERRLGGVTQAMFEATFGLDHERLRRGGEELAAGGGDAGQSLFDAGIGGGSVKRVLDALRAEADRLYSPRAHARTPLLNAALRELADKLKVVKNESTRPDAWPEQKKALAAARSELVRIEERRAELKRELGSVQEIVEILPLAARREAALAELALVRDAALLPDDASARRAVAERERDAALRDENASRVELDEIDGEIAGLELGDEALVLDDETIDALQARLGEYRRDQADLVKRRADLAASEELLRRRLAQLGRQGDADVRSLIPSRPALARVQGLAKEQVVGALELERARQRDQELELAEASLAAEMALWPELAGTLGVRPEVERAAWPALGRIEVFAKRFDALARRRERMDEQKSALERELFHARNELRELQRVRDLPSEEKLAAVRQERDRGWARVRELVSSKDQRPEPELLDAHERLVHSSDDLADRLRREAADVARVGGLEARLGAGAEALDALNAALRTLDAEQRALDAEWRELWHFRAGAPPSSPAEARELTERWERVSERRAELELSHARALVARERARELVEELERSRAAWQLEWAKAVALLGLSASASPAEADAVQAVLDELRLDVDKAESLRHRIDGMQRACAAFEEYVARLAREHAPDLAPADADRSASELVRRERRAREMLRRHQELSARRQRAKARAEQAATRRARAEHELSELLRQAGVTSTDELPAAEGRSTRRRAAERELSELERTLRETCGDASIDAALVRAAGLSLSSARVRAFELDEAIAELDQERDALRDQVRAAEAGLEVLDGKTSAAEHQADAAALEAKIRGYAERWARVRTALSLLESEIERYRRSHQGPVLARANRIFPELTLGAYSEIRVDVDAEPPVLTCVREDGRAVAVERLSEGTRDQLYLALRLASLGRFAEHGEPLPLVLDDVLIQFDEERVEHALRVLGRVAQSLQILLFTHHEHVVSAARRAIPEAELQVHVLSRAPAATLASRGALS